MTVISAVWDIREPETIITNISILMDQVMSLYNMTVFTLLIHQNSDGPN